MSLNVVELVKSAREAGFSTEDINNLIAREEERYNQQIEREERQRERELKKVEIVATEACKQREHELELAKLRAESSDTTRRNPQFSELKLPKFSEGKDDIKDYLTRFERIASLQGWKNENYHIYLGTNLMGKALKTYASLPVAVLNDYSRLKEALLKAYCLDADSYRKKFRDSKLGDNETYMQLITRMEQYLTDWLRLSEVEEDYNQLCAFLVRDQLLTNCPMDLRVFLKERLFSNTIEMAEAADRFKAAHRRPKSSKPFNDKEGTGEKPETKSNVVCHNCNVKGHIRPNCPELKGQPKGPSKKSHNVNFVFDTDLAPQNCYRTKAILFNQSVEAYYDSGCSTIITSQIVSGTILAFCQINIQQV